MATNHTIGSLEWDGTHAKVELTADQFLEFMKHGPVEYPYSKVVGVFKTDNADVIQGHEVGVLTEILQHKLTRKQRRSVTKVTIWMKLGGVHSL